jgi:hypothetical protein
MILTFRFYKEPLRKSKKLKLWDTKDKETIISLPFKPWRYLKIFGLLALLIWIVIPGAHNNSINLLIYTILFVPFLIIGVKLAQKTQHLPALECVFWPLIATIGLMVVDKSSIGGNDGLIQGLLILTVFSMLPMYILTTVILYFRAKNPASPFLIERMLLRLPAWLRHGMQLFAIILVAGITLLFILKGDEIARFTYDEFEYS